MTLIERKLVISELTSIISDNKNQNDNCIKAIKVELNDLDESISAETSNFNEKDKGMNFSKVI